ncbi:MAG: hypothetical protein ABF242_07185 [Flavobacteriales bacterium]
MKYTLIISLFLLASCATRKVNTDSTAVVNATETPVIARKINFNLTNDSDNSIPLLIPSVMSPNLSPKSSSAVTLKVGQEILFKYKFKKYLLIKIDDKIKSGDNIEVSELLANRKKELGLN